MAKRLNDYYRELDAFYCEENAIIDKANETIANYDELFPRNSSQLELSSVATLLNEIDAELEKAGKFERIIRKR